MGRCTDASTRVPVRSSRPFASGASGTKIVAVLPRGAGGPKSRSPLEVISTTLQSHEAESTIT
jgi:hypothetical protein